MFAGLMVACHARKATLYEFPPTMTGDVLDAYVADFNKGKILYDLNCSRCHTKQDGRKLIVPDFTEEQLVNYELRVSNDEHLENMPETKVTEDELVLIMTYLRYKKKNVTDSANRS